MTFTFCSSGAIVQKAGNNANSTAVASSAILEQASNDAEGFICTATRYDWITNYSSIASFAKLCLADAASNLGAKDIIGYDMESIGRLEASARINLKHDRALDCINLLKNYKRPVEEA